MFNIVNLGVIGYGRFQEKRFILLEDNRFLLAYCDSHENLIFRSNVQRGQIRAIGYIPSLLHEKEMKDILLDSSHWMSGGFRPFITPEDLRPILAKFFLSEHIELQRHGQRDMLMLVFA